TSAISHPSSGSSTSSYRSNRTNPAGFSSSSERPPAILENEETISFPDRPPMLFTESEGRLIDKSPMPLTPASSKLASPAGSLGLVSNSRRGDSAPATMNPGREARLSAGGHAVASKLHIHQGGQGDDGNDGRPAAGGSLDPKALAALRKGLPSLEEYHKLVEEQQREEAQESVEQMEDPKKAEKLASEADDGVLRKDMLGGPEERNASLEMGGKPSETAGTKASGWDRPFKIEWVKVKPIPFSRTRHIRNGFNMNKEVKISRDGTEIEPSAGEKLIEEFWRDEGGKPLPAGIPDISLPSPPDASGVDDGAEAGTRS
ncbi:hypothetical protein P7C70_g7685, partial [Phenoliferia sp. Uapishka_3]